MRAGRSNIEIVRVEDSKVDEVLVIRDVGPWNQFMSVTNDAEDVVHSLWNAGLLRHGMRLFYYDSADSLDELVHLDGMFTGFKPGPPGAPWGELEDSDPRGDWIEPL